MQRGPVARAPVLLSHAIPSSVGSEGGKSSGPPPPNPPRHRPGSGSDGRQVGAGLPITLQNEYFAGRIDEVRIWNYPRTADEIRAPWNRSLTGSEAGLVAYWRVDEGAGQVAHDSSPYHHDGELGASSATEALTDSRAVLLSGVPQLAASPGPLTNPPRTRLGPSAAPSTGQ